MGRQSRKVRGLARLVQMFIRVLLMTPGTNLLNPALGGGLLRDLKAAYTPGDVQDLRAAAYIAVQRTQEQLVTLQAREPQTPREEKLLSAKIEACNLSPVHGLVMDLQLLSQTGKRFLVSTLL